MVRFGTSLLCASQAAAAAASFATTGVTLALNQQQQQTKWHFFASDGRRNKHGTNKGNCLHLDLTSAFDGECSTLATLTHIT